MYLFDLGVFTPSACIYISFRISLWLQHIFATTGRELLHRCLGIIYIAISILNLRAKCDDKQTTTQHHHNNTKHARHLFLLRCAAKNKKKRKQKLNDFFLIFSPPKIHQTHLVVDEELRGHHDEAEHVHEAHEGVEHPAVPPAVLLVQQRVRGVPDHERRHQVQQVRRGDVVELLRLALEVWWFCKIARMLFGRLL